MQNEDKEKQRETTENTKKQIATGFTPEVAIGEKEFLKQKAKRQADIIKVTLKKQMERKHQEEEKLHTTEASKGDEMTQGRSKPILAGEQAT